MSDSRAMVAFCFYTLRPPAEQGKSGSDSIPEPPTPHRIPSRSPFEAISGQGLSQRALWRLPHHGAGKDGTSESLGNPEPEGCYSRGLHNYRFLLFWGFLIVIMV